ncbi:DUF6745 domain-containing protein [Rhizobium rhizogenes]|uniref:DUF6745 domain-containing protein n=1 Tax=Rhizobium rhizogenes TaxID=359 RepID=UPI0015D4DB19|nr:hypothetical protein [Rhizobium rhizogenes]
MRSWLIVSDIASSALLTRHLRLRNSSAIDTKHTTRGMNMNKIIRTKTRAEGGITPEEKARMDSHSKLWIARGMRTDPIEPEKIIPAIEGLYKVAGLKAPRVVIVPSPLVMAFAYGASAAILYGRKHAATRAATDAATDAATRAATRAATDAATRAATRAATDAATRARKPGAKGAKALAESDAARVCRELGGELGIKCAPRWYNAYQGGNMWAGYDCYLTACRDILGLELREHEGYAHWEQAAIHGGFRVMHEEFCLVSDFPEVLKVDDQNRPHCENGPSHQWRDGWCLYFWHGVQVPEHWIEDRANLDPNEVIRAENVEQRAAGAAIVGWAKMLDVLPHKIIDSHIDPQCGDLLEVSLPGLPETELYLKFECPRNGPMMEAVNKRELAKHDLQHAHAWHANVPVRLYSQPQQRS